MTPEEIKPGHTYECIGNPNCLVLAVVADSVTYRDCYGVAESGLADFARYAVRDVTPAPESDQGEKVAQAQSQGASRGDGMDVLPCPFCGDGGIIAGSIDLYCSTCGASGPSGAGSEAEDIARWNRRTPPAADAVKGELLTVVRRFVAEWDATWVDPDDINHDWAELYRQARAAIARAEAGE